MKGFTKLYVGVLGALLLWTTLTVSGWQRTRNPIVGLRHST